MTEILLSCEHGGNKIPKELHSLFPSSRKFFDSHRGWDPGALVIAKIMQKELACTLKFSEISRLVVDLNRSEDSPTLHTKKISTLSSLEREKLIAKFYRPYRSEMLTYIKRSKKVIRHFSIHSFTPIMKGVKRHAEIGILFDPAHKTESAIASRLKKNLEALFPEYRILLNYPYSGADDGQTTDLRKLFSAKKYAGIELELNQGLLKRLAKSPTSQKQLGKKLVQALKSSI